MLVCSHVAVPPACPGGPRPSTWLYALCHPESALLCRLVQMGAISLCEMFPLEALVSPTALLPLLWPSAAVKVLVEGVSLLFIECQAPSHAASVPLMLAAHRLSCGLGKGWPRLGLRNSRAQAVAHAWGSPSPPRVLVSLLGSPASGLPRRQAALSHTLRPHALFMPWQSCSGGQPMGPLCTLLTPAYVSSAIREMWHQHSLLLVSARSSFLAFIYFF